MERTNFILEESEVTTEPEIIRQDHKIKPASLIDLYRYITGKYYVLLGIAVVNALIAGVTNPTRLDVADDIREKALILGIQAVVCGICCYIFCLLFTIIGAKISYELKWRYFKAILSQNCNWYESQNIEELPTQISVNITEVENATGKTTGFILFSVGAFIGGFCCSFIIGALLACCYLIIMPYTLICGISRSQILIKGNQKIEKAYETSGADAEQALMSIRVVKAFGQEQNEFQKYVNHLDKAKKSTVKYSVL